MNERYIISRCAKCLQIIYVDEGEFYAEPVYDENGVFQYNKLYHSKCFDEISQENKK